MGMAYTRYAERTAIISLPQTEPNEWDFIESEIGKWIKSKCRHEWDWNWYSGTREMDDSSMLVVIYLTDGSDIERIESRCLSINYVEVTDVYLDEISKMSDTRYEKFEKEMMAWLDENVPANKRISFAYTDTFQFFEESDAVAFKLRWA